MKNLLYGALLMGLCTGATPSRSAGTPLVDYATISEIIELYRDGQFEVVRAKLANQGFAQSSAEPDYTLHGRVHRGKFTMTYVTDSPSAGYRQLGFKQESSWDFSTEIDGRVQETNIIFHLPARLDQAQYVYASLVDVWRDAGLERSTLTCSTAVDCIRLYGPINGAPAGYQDFAWLGYDVYNTTVQELRSGEGTTAIIALNGNLTYRRVKQLPAASKAVHKAPTAIKYKKK